MAIEGGVEGKRGMLTRHGKLVAVDRLPRYG